MASVISVSLVCIHSNSVIFFLSESSSPPRDLTGRALNSTSIQLEWEPPALEDQNGHITSYTVLCFAVSQTLIMQSTSDNVITLSGLHPYTMYSCNVSAVTVAEGPFSDSVNVTTVEDGMYLFCTVYLLHVIANYSFFKGTD